LLKCSIRETPKYDHTKIPRLSSYAKVFIVLFKVLFMSFVNAVAEMTDGHRPENIHLHHDPTRGR